MDSFSRQTSCERPPRLYADATSKDPAERLAMARHHFGEHGGVNMSVEASTTFTVMQSEKMADIFQGHGGPGCYLYGRHYNPTVCALSDQMAALEGTEAAYCTSSGMAAISAALLGLLTQGDHIVASNTLYGGTWALLAEFLPKKCGITTTFVDIHDGKAVVNAIQERTKVVYTETLSNPTLRVTDIPALAHAAHQRGLKLVIDNTFSPLAICPAHHGADVVLHSVTKFINGSSDVIAGVVCASADFIAGLMDLHMGPLMLLGPTMDPFVAHSIGLRLPHLPIRMAEHARRAQFFAEQLSKRGVAVSYPGLPQHPDHQLFAKLATNVAEYGYGGVLTIDAGSRAAAEQLMNDLQNVEGFGFIAVSLGYFDTLMSCSASSTSSEMTDEALRAAGIEPGLVRISVGITGSMEQRWGQLERALGRHGPDARCLGA